MSRPSEIVERKSRRRAVLQKSMDVIVQQLKGLGALKIIVFGSFAEGKVDVDSDLDLFVAMPSARAGKEWTNIIFDRVDRKVALDIIADNEDEFRDMLPASRFLKSVVKGALIYEKTA
jgi:predicted nucleotidyltransferase